MKYQSICISVLVSRVNKLPITDQQVSQVLVFCYVKIFPYFALSTFSIYAKLWLVLVTQAGFFVSKSGYSVSSILQLY